MTDRVKRVLENFVRGFRTVRISTYFELDEDCESFEIKSHQPWPKITATAVGLVSTLMSIGGATFVVPLLTLYGFAILPAVATASGVGSTGSTAGGGQP